ncbi:ABC transporter ATP-binding protein [Methylophilaceae bacterium]|nr:ABC transporter ATP-binding protein [Methylophilaceae bacterium]|tara:strand:+ start:6967 stop:7806 length:840 start_codon:yes stop_codon:yes gene_type:complete
MKKDIIKINNLSIKTKVNTNLYLVDGISFSVKEGKTTCIVGESGSGKSLTALSIIRLLSPQLKMSGEILFNNEDICKMSELEIRQKRGLDIAMIFQEPMTSLNPVLTIGYQIKEAIAVHSDLPNNKINKKVEELLILVGIPVERVNSYPDELSGGQRQRVMIAMAMSCNPKLLIADEPTTALDVTVQAQILKLLDDLKRKLNMSMLFITHDFGVVEDIADDVIVMFKGKIVERGEVNHVLKKPKHPYTKALLGCVPDALGKKQLTPIDYEKLDRAIQRL